MESIDRDPVLDLLNLTPEEFQEKQRIWCAAVKKDVREARKQIIHYLKRRHPGVELSQKSLRYYSSIYSGLPEPSRPKSPFKELLPIAASSADCYHQTHFINTALLLGAHTPDGLPAGPTAPAVNICEVNLDEPSRVEQQQYVYHTLLDHLEASASTPASTTRVTLTEVYEALKNLEAKIDELLLSKQG